MQLLSSHQSFVPLPLSGEHPRQISSTVPEYHGDKDDNDGELEIRLPQHFQRLLQTRRSNNHFVPISLEDYDRAYWREILDRAVLCGYSAPNHRRTEPFTFKRMIAPSPKTERLADIAYNVNLLKHVQRQDRQPLDSDVVSRESMEASAERKRERWNQIPAFLVALVRSQQPVVDAESSLAMNPYELLPYVAPESERELEDYASSCAAVQNVLLSLHSEHVASKWVTGPIVRTPAFRDLVEASPNDRVVGLVMVGQPDLSRPPFPRRRHRQLHGDVLIDL